MQDCQRDGWIGVCFSGTEKGKSESVMGKMEGIVRKRRGEVMERMQIEIYCKKDNDFDGDVAAAADDDDASLAKLIKSEKEK